MAIHEMVLFLATLIVIVFQTIIFAEGSISSQIPKGCPAPVKADPTCVGLETCDVRAQETACELLMHHERGRIQLKSDHYDPPGNSPNYDGASPLSNIRDHCQGTKVKRSSYCPRAPGGCTCLKYEMLASLRDYAINFYSKYHQAIRVIILAGGCAWPNSTHYEGRAFAVSCKFPRDHCDELAEWCRSRSEIEPCYPGGGNCVIPIPKEAGNYTWVDCTF